MIVASALPDVDLPGTTKLQLSPVLVSSEPDVVVYVVPPNLTLNEPAAALAASNVPLIVRDSSLVMKSPGVPVSVVMDVNATEGSVAIVIN